jgi:hypothetical protein
MRTARNAANWSEQGEEKNASAHYRCMAIEARTRITGAKLKGLGVVPGVSDLLILFRGTAAHLEQWGIIR